MPVRDACFIKYCRAKKTTEQLKIHVEYKTLRNEVKMKTKQAKKNYCQDLFENKNPLTGPTNCKKTTRHHAHLSLCAKS